MILVTGATGTVGSEVVKQLVAAGERPRVFVRDPVKGQRLGSQVEQVVGDLDRPETIAAALVDVDRLFLVTTQSPRQPDWECSVIEAATSAGVRRVVKLSVFNADQRSPLQIARQHRQAEHTLEESGLAATILRPVFFMQNLLGMVRGDKIATAAGKGRVAMIDARDIAAVAAAALLGDGHAGKTYTLTGPEALTFDDVARIVSQQTCRQISHVEVPPEGIRSTLQAVGVPAWFAGDMATLQSMLADGYEEDTTDDVRSVTGGPPRTLHQFAADFADSFAGQSGR
jgi:uncharacterized protein YbjT (DUF2867 family)